MRLNVELLEQSFARVPPKAAALVPRFYECLFQKYPEVKPLFKHASMADQKKLIASLQTPAARHNDAQAPRSNRHRHINWYRLDQRRRNASC